MVVAEREGEGTIRYVSMSSMLGFASGSLGAAFVIVLTGWLGTVARNNAYIEPSLARRFIRPVGQLRGTSSRTIRLL